MRKEYLRSGIKYINNVIGSKINQDIVDSQARDFERELLFSLSKYGSHIVKNRREFLSSRKEIRFSKSEDEFIYLILRNIFVSNYLLRDDFSSNLSPFPVKNLFNEGVLKINSEFSRSENIKLANLIKNQGSFVFKENNSLAKNFSEIDDIVGWIEREVKKVIQSVFNVYEKTIDRQFRDNSFLQIAPVSPKVQNSDHQSDLHMDTFFPALKWWYFPNEVNAENGPFQYLTTSPSPRSELYEFMRDALMLNIDNLSAKSLESHNEGSLRGDVGKSEKLFGSKLTPITCPAGTLIVANVMGLHARGYSKVPEQRFALHGSFRSTIHDQYSMKNFIRRFI